MSICEFPRAIQASTTASTFCFASGETSGDGTTCAANSTIVGIVPISIDIICIRGFSFMCDSSSSDAMFSRIVHP